MKNPVISTIAGIIFEYISCIGRNYFFSFRHKIYGHLGNISGLGIGHTYFLYKASSDLVDFHSSFIMVFFGRMLQYLSTS